MPRVHTHPYTSAVYVQDRAQGSASEFVFRFLHLFWACFLLFFLLTGVFLGYIHYDKLTYWSFTIVTAWFVLSFVGYFAPVLLEYCILFLLPVALGVSVTVMFLIVAVIVRDPSVFWHATKMFGGDVSFSVAYAGDHFLHFIIPVTLFLHICTIHCWIRRTLFHVIRCGTLCAKVVVISWTLFGAMLVLLLYNFIFDPQAVYETDFPTFMAWAIAFVIILVVNSSYLLLMLADTSRHFTSSHVPYWLECCDREVCVSRPSPPLEERGLQHCKISIPGFEERPSSNARRVYVRRTSLNTGI